MGFTFWNEWQTILNFSWYKFFLRCTCSYHVVYQIHTIKYVLPFWIFDTVALLGSETLTVLPSQVNYIYCLHSHINDSHINGNPPSMFSVIYSSLHTARRLCVWQLLKWPIFSICGSVSCLFATNPQAKIFVQKTELKRCCSSEIDSLSLLKSLFKTSHSLW